VPRVPSDKNLEAMVLYLTHPDINLLSLEELEEPEMPFLLARLFSEYLRHDEHSQIIPPPVGLAGIFNSAHQSADKLSRIDVELTIQTAEQNVLRVVEKMETYSYPPEIAQTAVSSNRDPTLQNRRLSEGWAVLTPEDHLIMFMKQKPYAHNHFYTTVALNPGLWAERPTEQLVLMRHEYPVEYDPIPEALEDLMKEAGSDMMCLRFNRSAAS
jgi:hypothetical protein